MKRRRYLLALGMGALAGCAGRQSGSDGGSGGGSTAGGATNGGTGGGTTSGGTGGGETDGGATGQSGFQDVELPVPESELRRGAPEDAIPAITDPVFDADWSEVPERASQYDVSLPSAPTLSADDPVIGVERGGSARAYPLSILNWHEVVNDTFDGPLLVTFCPLCGSGVTANRRVAGEETMFGVSGLLWRSDLVMYDEATDSLWSQILATAIRGPRTGDVLDLVPSTMTTWGEWRDAHPDTQVLLPPPISNTVQGRVGRDYNRDPYAGYSESDNVGIGFNDFDDDRLHPKARVIGIAHDGAARAYPLENVTADGRVVNDEVGGLPVVVAVGPDDTLVAYERRVDGETLSFEADGDAHMRAGGSRWRITTGRAVDGPHEGTQLATANDRSPMFWFAWADFNPETDVYGPTSGTSTGG